MTKTLLAMCFCAICCALSAQTSAQTFTSPDGVFQFTHSSILIPCTVKNGSWVPADACSSQGGLCDDVSSSETIVCFAYPKDKFIEKPAFGGAAFFVEEIRDSRTAKKCLTGEDWLVHRTESTTINGVPFKVFHISDAWAGGSQSGDIYRAFHGNICYELGIQQVGVSTGSLDPGTFQEFSKKDAEEVRLSLDQALRSFRFLKLRYCETTQALPCVRVSGYKGGGRRGSTS